MTIRLIGALLCGGMLAFVAATGEFALTAGGASAAPVAPIGLAGSNVENTALVCGPNGCIRTDAQSGPFDGMAGVWSGGGTVMLDDGSTERIRCRATYAVAGDGSALNQSLTCASDSYRFNLASNVVASGGSLSGTWSESSRGITGSLEGRGANGNFQVIASAPGLTANVTLTLRGNRQSVVIRAESQFRGASISLSRS
jgi:hypothetical protein